MIQLARYINAHQIEMFMGICLNFTTLPQRHCSMQVIKRLFSICSTDICNIRICGFVFIKRAMNNNKLAKLHVEVMRAVKTGLMWVAVTVPHKRAFFVFAFLTKVMQLPLLAVNKLVHIVPWFRYTSILNSFVIDIKKCLQFARSFIT